MVSTTEYIYSINHFQSGSEIKFQMLDDWEI